MASHALQNSIAVGVSSSMSVAGSRSRTATELALVSVFTLTTSFRLLHRFDADESGTPGGIRTPGPLVRSQVL
jgi:hypothetical protein